MNINNFFYCNHREADEDLMTKKYYGYYTSPIGILEIICSEDEVLSVMFAEKEDKITKTNAILEKTMLQLNEYFNGSRKEFDLKIRLEGTDFQKQVWHALTKIPYAKTLTYKELALKVGNEKAMRAVGNANSKNKVGIIIPCHRVIGSNGDLTGYAGGKHRKKWLLEHEKKMTDL